MKVVWLLTVSLDGRVEVNGRRGEGLVLFGLAFSFVSFVRLVPFFSRPGAHVRVRLHFWLTS